LKLRAVTALIFICIVSCLHTSGRYYDDYSILIESAQMPLQGKIYGYEDISLKLHNSSEISRTVKIKLAGNNRSSQLESISKTVTLGGGESSVVTLSKPYLAMRGIEVLVQIDNTPQKAFSLSSYSKENKIRWTKPVSILLSEKLSYDFFDNLLNAKDSYRANSINIYRSEKLPDTANAYSGFDSVLLSAEQISSCSAKAADILYKYVRSGGSLFVAGEFEPDANTIKSSVGEDLHYHECGLGLIIVADKAAGAGIKKLNWSVIADKLWGNPLFVYRHINPGSNINDWFRVVEVSSVPVKAMVAIIALVVVIMGPVNILVLRFINRSILLYITIPVISILGVAAILTSSIKNEGTGNTEKTQSFTIIDHRSGQASTAAVLGYYCPIFPIGELNFKDNTQVIPLNQNQYGGNNKHITLDDEQKLFGSWINSRVPSHFAAIKVSSDNKSIVTFAEKSGGAIEASNNSSRPVISLRYKDNLGRVWQSERIEPKQKSLLKPLKRVPASMELCPVRKMYSSDWLKSGSNVYNNPYENIHPGCYIAAVAGELFLEQPAEGKISHQDRNSYVYGITGEKK
jgi:hypothetical protein